MINTPHLLASHCDIPHAVLRIYMYLLAWFLVREKSGLLFQSEAVYFQGLCNCYWFMVGVEGCRGRLVPRRPHIPQPLLYK